MAIVSSDMIDLPGLDENLRGKITERVGEFESKHEINLLSNGDGWIPRITAIDYIIAGSVNLLITIWMVVSLS
jgi:hypothetical protein